MVVRMRHTRAHTKNRRSHHALTAPAIVIDRETGKPHLRHRISKETGMYKGRQVLNTVKKAEKKIAKSTKSKK